MSTSTLSDVSTKRSDIVRYSENQIGSKYKYAGRGPRNFDCSGLVNYVYSQANYPLSGSSESMSRLSSGIKQKNVQPGDLVFFKKSGRVFHVSIVVEVSEGEIWVVHSTTSRGVIREDILASQYWREKIYKIISLAELKTQYR